MKIDWRKMWRAADMNRYFSRFFLLVALIHTVLLAVGHFQGKDVSENALWAIAMAVTSMALRALARIDDLAYELRDRAEALAIVVDGHERRLREMDERLSAVVVRRRV